MPECCDLVPVLHDGEFNEKAINYCISYLKGYGSQAAPGFKRPEGIVVYHEASNTMFKKTIEKDDSSKSLA